MVVNKFNHDAPWEARARFRRQRQRWSPPGSKLDLNRGISTLKSLALVGNASGRTLRKGLTLDPRRFRSRLATPLQMPTEELAAIGGWRSGNAPRLDRIDPNPPEPYSRLRIVRAIFTVLVRAASNGVMPLLPFECTSAPLEMSSLVTSAWSQLTERRRGVSPRLSRASMFAPQSNNASATSTLPRRAAMCSAVQCFTPSWASTFAPA